MVGKRELFVVWDPVDLEENWVALRDLMTNTALSAEGRGLKRTPEETSWFMSSESSLLGKACDLTTV